MEKRFKKEYKINLNDEFKIKMGTVNRFNPKVVYVNCRTWLTPSEHNTTNQVHEILYNLQKKMLTRVNILKVSKGHETFKNSLSFVLLLFLLYVSIELYFTPIKIIYI